MPENEFFWKNVLGFVVGIIVCQLQKLCRFYKTHVWCFSPKISKNNLKMADFASFSFFKTEASIRASRAQGSRGSIACHRENGKWYRKTVNGRRISEKNEEKFSGSIF